MTFSIHTKDYNHFNRAMNKHITSKKQYDEEMKKGGYCTFKEAESRVAKSKAKQTGYSGLSKDAEDLIRDVAGRNKKNFKLSDRQIDAMKELGTRFERQGEAEKRGQGGFSNASNQ